MKYTPSGLASEFSGSIGSTTASRNRFGPYFRNRVLPVNPNSQAQQDVRVQFQTLTERWRSLSASARAAWAGLGAQMQRLDPLGATYSLTGAQAYMSVNSNRGLLGLAIDDDPPTLPSIPAVGGLVLTADTDPAQVLTLDFTPTPLAAGTYLVIEATDALSAGIEYVSRGQFKFIQAVAPAGTSPANIISAWEAIYGDISFKVNGKIHVRARIVGDTGFSGTPAQTSAVVA